MAARSVSPCRQASASNATSIAIAPFGAISRTETTRRSRMRSFAAAGNDAWRRLERLERSRPIRGEADQNVCGVIAATFGSIGPRMRLITADSTKVHSIDVTM